MSPSSDGRPTPGRRRTHHATSRFRARFFPGPLTSRNDRPSLMVLLPVTAQPLFFSAAGGQSGPARISYCMGTLMSDEPGETEDLLVRAACGDREALAALWERHRKRLRQMVRLRLDRRLQGRVDPSDVL